MTGGLGNNGKDLRWIREHARHYWLDSNDPQYGHNENHTLPYAIKPYANFTAYTYQDIAHFQEDFQFSPPKALYIRVKNLNLDKELAEFITKLEEQKGVKEIIIFFD